MCDDRWRIRRSTQSPCTPPPYSYTHSTCRGTIQVHSAVDPERWQEGGQQPLNSSYIIPDLRHFHVNEDVDVVVTDSSSGQYRIGRSAHSDSTKR